MANLKSDVKVKIDLSATITLSEIEMRALDAMFGYGADAFLRGFYKECGRAYVEPFEGGVRSLHDSALRQIRSALHNVDSIRDKLK